METEAKRNAGGTAHRKPNKLKKALQRWKKRFCSVGTMNLVLIAVFLYMILINAQMLQVYRAYGSAPESAWCALIAALLGECGICGWIKTTKEKNRDQQQEKERERGGINPNDPPEDEE